MSQTITRRKKSGRTSKRKNALRKRIEESHIENETSNEASQASTQDETCLGAWGSPLSDETKQGCDQNCAQPCVEDAVSLKQADVLEFDPFCLPDGIELNDCGSNVLLGDCVDGILSAKEGELCVSDLSWSI